MLFKDYPELDALKTFVSKNDVSVLLLDSSESIFEGLKPVKFSIAHLNCTIHISDEYDDLTINSTFLNIVLAIRELENIDDSSDFLEWANSIGANASNMSLLSYYQDVVIVLPKIKAQFPRGILNSFVSCLDFELNAGAAQFLRNSQPIED